MMTDITIAKETQLFLYSLALGVGLSACYDLLRVIRGQTRHRAGTVCAEDILYFLLSSVVTFGFLLRDNCGEVRAYLLAGELIGWILWHCTLGAAAVAVCGKIVSVIKRILFFWLRLIFSPVVGVLRFAGRFLQKFLKKVVQKQKYNLKRERIMMYNLLIRWKKTRRQGGEPNGCIKEKEETQQ